MQNSNRKDTVLVSFHIKDVFNYYKQICGVKTDLK